MNARFDSMYARSTFGPSDCALIRGTMYSAARARTSATTAPIRSSLPAKW